MRSEVVWKVVDEEGRQNSEVGGNDGRRLRLEIEGKESENGDDVKRSIFLSCVCCEMSE